MNGSRRHRPSPEAARAGTAPPVASAATPPTSRRVYLVLCAVLIAVAGVLVGRYLAASPAPPAPASALGAIPAAGTGPSAPAGAPAAALPDPSAGVKAAAGNTPETGYAPAAPLHATPMTSSVPVSVRAASAGIDSSLLQVALNKDGTIEVPHSYSEAAWYRLGPTPGELGPAVLIGHVDSYQGPGVFFKIGAMRPGQIIDVTRADRSVAHFRVDAINSYPKDKFPTQTVYGPIDYAGLRLITCGGAFNSSTRSYESNTVVFASLRS